MKLAIKFEGETLDAEPVSVLGLGLVCRLPSTERRLGASIFVTQWQADDPLAFWTAWESLGGAGEGLVWEDGSEFHPPIPPPARLPERFWLVRLLRWLLRWLLSRERH